MSLSSNIKTYLKNINSYESIDDNPLETIKNKPRTFRHTLLNMQKDMSELENSLNPARSVDELVNAILKLDTIIRICGCIENVSGDNNIIRLEEFKKKEFKFYTGSLRRLGITG